MKIAVITGEESGDKLAASAIKELKLQYKKNIHLFGIGGNALKKQGIDNLFDISEINVMGLIEVLPKVLKINTIINKTVDKIIEMKPDIVFTVDSPDFTLRVARRIKSKKRELKIVHYVAPSVWAWRPGRIKTVKKSVDHLLTILPFEKKIFDSHNIKTTFVGHPITEVDLSEYKSDTINKPESSQKEIFLIMPGSRRKEIEMLLPTYLGAVDEMNLKTRFRLVIPTTKNMTKTVKSIIEDYSSNIPIEVIDDEKEKYLCFFNANFAIVTSGTAALELSYFNTLYVTAYRFNPLTYFLLNLMIKSKIGNLINIILGKMVIPELLQNECNKKNIIKFINKYLEDENYRSDVINQTKEAIKQLSTAQTPSRLAATAILDACNEK
mgnify:FL=1